MPTPMKQVAILSGWDWNDAGVDHVSVPADLNMRDANREYEEWRKANKYAGPPTYRTFSEWLRLYKGAKESSVEIFEEE